MCDHVRIGQKLWTRPVDGPFDVPAWMAWFPLWYAVTHSHAGGKHVTRSQ